MKHIPILFSTPMVQAILAGRKTMTRRILKVKGCMPLMPKTDWDIDAVMYWTKNYHPHGQPGDVLWVRESWAPLGDYPTCNYDFMYKADVDKPYSKWKPSIHMPKEACRFWQMVTRLRIERVADIREEDAIAEGVECLGTWEVDNHKYYNNYLQEGDDQEVCASAKESFKTLWQKINGTPTAIQSKVNGKLVTTGYIVYPFDASCAEPWNGKTTYRGKPLTVITNPWVWVISFEPCDMPKDFLIKHSPHINAVGNFHGFM
jgi:hypothetical protein